MPSIEPGPEGLRAGDLLGRTVHDEDGEPIGRIADLQVEDGVVVAAVVTAGPWGRLLGYERESAHGPWILETLARKILRRDSRRIPWADLRL
jgi:sporulation protein YlmC with PRC-barrel domain